MPQISRGSWNLGSIRMASRVKKFYSPVVIIPPDTVPVVIIPPDTVPVVST